MRSPLSLAAIALVGSASFAVAQPYGTNIVAGDLAAVEPVAMSQSRTHDTPGNSFALARVQPNDSVVELFAVTASADGIVDIYDYNIQSLGRLMGTQIVTEGANSEMHISLLGRPLGNLLAVMSIDGRVVAEQEIDLRREAN
jgi:hypothetical protein